MKKILKSISFFLIFVCASQLNATAQIITTIAGDGSFGNSGDGGPATDAKIFPDALCVDIRGTVYAASSGYSEIRKIDTAGIINAFAGNGTDGFIDGVPATMATISYYIPSITVDKAGNIYFVDLYNFRVRKVDTSGIITTVAGNGAATLYYLDGGMATAMGLGLSSIAVDNSGNIYLSDAISDSEYIRKINPAGIISTVAGNGAYGYSGDGGPATLAQVNVGAMIVDDSGNIYFTDGGDNRVRKFNPSTDDIITTVAGNGIAGDTGDGGQATTAELEDLSGLAIDRVGNLFISTGNRIRKVTPSGIITTIAGTGAIGSGISYSSDGGPATDAQITAAGIAVDTGGSIYLAGLYTGRVRKITFHHYPPYFTGGHSLGLLVCENSVADSINVLLAVTNTDTGQTNAWSTVTAPMHGMLAAAYSTVATGGSVAASGLYYTPAAGYTGSDSFKVRVTDGYYSDTTTVHVTIPPLISTISGPASECPYAAITLSNATTGGTWSTSSTAIATVDPASGTVTGIAAGTAIITYSVSGTCGAASTTMHITVNPLPATGAIIGPATVCVLSVAAFADGTTGGTWSSSATGLATITSYGFVTGVSGGMDTISYSVSNSCGTVAAVKPVTIIPLAVAGTITGPPAVCPGATISLSDLITGGAWSNSFTAIATISGTGVVTGITPGVDTLFYTIITGCSAATVKKTVTVNPLATVAAITGTASVCVAASTTLSDAITGGLWSSGNTGIATIGSTGTAYGVAADTVSIYYTVINSCSTAVATELFTVNPLPSAGAITGTTPIATGICTGATASLSDTATGGAWSSGSTSASVAAGLVTALVAGIDTISYSVSNSCGVATATLTITVDPLPFAGTITGPSILCADTSITLSDAVTGGIWSSDAATGGIATVSSSGIVSALSAGSLVLFYTVTNSCGTATVTKAITVNPLPVSGIISGSTTLCEDSVIVLNDGATGGTWASGNTGIASIDNTGVATGVAAGTAAISYSVTNSCGTSVAVQMVTVVPCVLAINTPTAAADKLSIYPNPSPGIFTVMLSSANNNQISFTITDIVGKQVKEFIARTNQPTEVNIAFVAPGVYVVQGVDGVTGERIMRRMVVE